jgi:hypothetical protein
MPIQQLTVPPQKVAETNCSWATGDVHQSKVFLNQPLFWVFFFPEEAAATYIYYSTSENGISWDTKTLSLLAIYKGLSSNVDVTLKNATACYLSFIVNKEAPYIARGDISGSTITRSFLWSVVDVGYHVTKSKANLRLDGKLYILVHRSYNQLDALYIPDPWATGTRYAVASINFSENSGGVQLLNYKESNDMLVIIKQGTDNVLYSAILYENMTLSSLTSIATLASGFNTFCVTSEFQNVGDPEKVHLVYIKSTGELCYRKFENDAWSDETVLIASGASYPVIAAGKAGRLYVFYVKDNVIKLLKYNGASWGSEETLFPEHTYNNPAYLSSNQNVQHGQICLVWTEGTASPYEVWFCTIGD